MLHIDTINQIILHPHIDNNTIKLCLESGIIRGGTSYQLVHARLLIAIYSVVYKDLPDRRQC